MSALMTDTTSLEVEHSSTGSEDISCSPGTTLESGIAAPDFLYMTNPAELASDRLPLDEDAETASVKSDRTVEPHTHMQRLDSFEVINAHASHPEHFEKENRTRPGTATSASKAAPFPPSEDEDVFDNASIQGIRSRSGSASSKCSDGSGEVDWAGLEQEERAEARDEATDESTAFLLARLEQENNALAIDPRFNALKGRPRKQSRPPSMHVLKKLVNDQSGPTSRYSVIAASPPPMTELEFWAALVKDYQQTAQRLPTLTSNKLKAGVPPPLRGVVWTSMAGARDTDLGQQFDRLCLETSPYENLIGKDVGRSFPGVEMFRDPEGEGQIMLGRVLRCFSLYDEEIGYCQGLGFIVGPLLMHMNDKDAFCILVKLMENYDLRSCFTPNLSGLHVRIYQFQRLLNEHMPELAAHLASLQVEAAYLSQWFLSFFAVTCPLPMLFRIYDVIFAEGASETIMRVALSLMRRNEQKIMASREFEEVMQLLLSRSLWEEYSYDADELVNDFMEMTGLVSRESLKAMEVAFRAQHGADAGAWFTFLPDATAAASRFLGRVWTASTPLKGGAGGLAVGQTSHSRAPSFLLRRSPSKQSIAASMNSADISSDGTMHTDATAFSSRESGEGLSMHSKTESMMLHIPGAVTKEDKDLHNQIEDLLTALSDMQRHHAILSAQLQKEREERGEDFQVFGELVRHVKAPSHIVQDRLSITTSEAELKTSSASEDSRCAGLGDDVTIASAAVVASPEFQDAMERADQRLMLYESMRSSRSSDVLETKQRLRDSLIRSRGQLDTQLSRSAALSRQLDDQEKETLQVREHLRQAQARIQDEVREKHRLEETIQTLKDGASSNSASRRSSSMIWGDTQDRLAISNRRTSNSTGLRELKLARPAPLSDQGSNNLSPNLGSSIPKRGSSLATQAILATEDHVPATEDELLVELVSAKTSETQARVELDEVKNKLEAMRKMLGMPSPPVVTPSHKISASESAVMGTPSRHGTGSSNGSNLSPASSNTAGGGVAALSNLWGWGKRNASTSTAIAPQASAGAEER